MQCICINDTTQTQCKGHVGKGATMCARHTKKPSKNCTKSVVKPAPQKSTVKKQIKPSAKEENDAWAESDAAMRRPRQTVIASPKSKGPKPSAKEENDAWAESDAAMRRPRQAVIASPKSKGPKPSEKEENDAWAESDAAMRRSRQVPKSKNSAQKPRSVKTTANEDPFSQWEAAMHERRQKPGVKKASAKSQSPKDESTDVKLLKETSLETMQKLYDLTEAPYRFPDWIFEVFQKDDVFENLMSSAKVYYHNSPKADIDTLKKLVKEREPNNIARNRSYDQAKMMKTFGWKVGFYDRYFAVKKELAPNIAVYTPAIVKRKGSEDTKVNILNVIGLAFDDQKQSDYQYFFGPKSKLTEVQAKKEILHIYKQIFETIYKCAKDHSLKTIVMNAVGMGFFKEHFPGNMFTEIFVKAFTTIKVPAGIELVWMGLSNGQKDALKANDIGRFPACISKIDPESTLITNAWDMVSIPGNGHGADNSLDGFCGRCSTISVTGQGMTNPFLTKSENYIVVN
jgi:hypothetical protein